MTALRVIPSPYCLLCLQTGSLVHSTLLDDLYGVPGQWNYYLCPACQLLWLHPRPQDEDLPSCYQNYYTHKKETPNHQEAWSLVLRWHVEHFLENLARHLLGYSSHGPHQNKTKNLFLKILTSIPFIQNMAMDKISGVPWTPHGRLLDVGCGKGEFLAQMKSLGWEVEGVEFDPIAAQSVQEIYRISIISETLESLAKMKERWNTYDVITLNHVIEHFSHPLQELGFCHQLLRPGGFLILWTPNLTSLGYSLFRTSWGGIEPPRHLFIFSPNSLSKMVEKSGLTIKEVKTSGRGAHFMAELCSLRQRKQPFPSQIHPHLFSWLFAVAEQLALTARFPIGEEIFLKAMKE